MGAELLPPFELLLGGPALIGGALLATRLVPMLIAARRQAAYDRAAAVDLVRWTLRVDPSLRVDADASARLIAGLHPGVRRGLGRWALGWPQVSLEVVWNAGRASWQLVAPRQLARLVEAAVAAAYPGAELERLNDPPVPTPTMRLGLSGRAPDGTTPPVETITPRLVELLSRLPPGGAARWRIRLRPLPPRAAHAGGTGSGLGGEVLAAMLNRPMERAAPRARPETPVPATPAFSAMIEVEVWANPPTARAWLFDALSLVAIIKASGWPVEGRIGASARPIEAEAAWLAGLWSPPARGDAERAVEVLRSRRLPASRRLLAGERRIARQPDGDVHLPAEVFLRHAAFIGGTGSGKSTQMVGLAADDLAAGRGFTFLDPHGDAVARLLDAVPPAHVERVHLIELASRVAPRGVNFLELDGADPELVAVQFVDTLYDLYARYSGPKQTHYLRMALLTLLAREPDPAAGPWTVVDLYQLLVNRDVRRRFTAELADEVLQDFWSHEWPLDNPRAREPSVEAVLNKLGGFIAYPTIRDIVGARRSTIRPRRVMDGGEVLLVDLSRVGRDHARLFGSMLIGRYYVDALGRQGTPAAQRVPHQLYIDEVHNFDTSSLRGILTETRKFGLGLTLATQYVRRLQPELGAALRSNVATLGLLQPAAEDVSDLGALFAPLAERDLHQLPRFRMALRTEVDDERQVMTVDVLGEPPSLGSTDAVRRSSDRRDGQVGA